MLTISPLRSLRTRMTPYALCLAALFTAPLQAIAEDAEGVEKITVYGALNQQPQSQLASSVSVLSQADIEQRQAQHLQDMLNRSANVNFASGASRGRFLQIRGIGERSQFVDPVNPSVGYLVDGISYTGMVAGASMFDLEQVEIFKGPNSARFGEEGLAGVVNVISREATADTRLNLQAGVANYASWNAGLAVGGALLEGVNARLSVHKNVSDGFIENTYLGRDDTNGVDEFTSRLKLAWQVTPDLQIKTVFHAIDVDNGYDAFSLNLDRTTLSDEPGFDRQDSKAIALEGHYQGMAWTDIMFRATTLNADLAYGYDEDWSYVGIAPYDPINDPDGYFAEYSSTDHYFRDRDDDSLELRFSSKTASDNTWTVGLRVADEQEDLLREYFDFDLWADASFDSRVERTDQALYGLYKHDLSEQSWLTFSGRLASQSLDYVDARQVVVSGDDTDWGAEISYHYAVSKQAMTYLSLLRSFKMGGVNGEALSKVDDPELEPFRDILETSQTFDPESLLGLEFGVKGGSEDGAMTLDFAAFYQRRDDIQYRNWVVRDQSFVGLMDNAAEGTNYGIEFELAYRFASGSRVFVNAGWLETEIDGITRQGETTVINGRDQAHAPNYQVNAGFDWQLSDNWQWLIEVDAKDGFYYSFAHDEQADDLVLVHSNLDYRAGDWQVSLYVRNLFDEEYANRGFRFGNDPRDGYTTKTYEQLGEPRRIGVNLRFHY